jgi:hypothetical protein
MSIASSGGLTAALLTLSPLIPSRAAAPPPLIPIIYGHGETIAHLGDLPPDVRNELRRELNQDVALGYAYSYFHIFWGNLWTWNGRYVLYQGNRYWELKPEGLKQIVGKTERELGKPFAYRFPLGLVIGVPLIVSVCIVGAFSRTDAERVQKLLTDSRYREALEVLSKPVSGQPAPQAGAPGTSAEPGEDLRFEAAVEHLYRQGVPRAKAEANLRLILQTLVSIHPPGPPAAEPPPAAG